MLDLSGGQWLLQRSWGPPLVSKQKARGGKGKEAALVKSRGKKKAPSQEKSKRKMGEASLRGFKKKKKKTVCMGHMGRGEKACIVFS